jgi:tRNA(Ile)-lysidine synthetase-like protein
MNTFWFSKEAKKHWFDKSYEFDKYVYDNYLHEYLKLEIPIDNITKEKYINYILYYDQISRHLNRIDSNILIPDPLNILDFIDKYYNMFYDDLSNNELCFVLMPFRHTNIYCHFYKVQNEIWKRMKMYKNNDIEISILKRFLTATYNNFLKRGNYDSLLYFYKDLNTDNISPKDFESIIDFDTHTNIDIDSDIDIISEIQSQSQSQTHIENVNVISLSGGVDSMVLSYCLKKFLPNLVAIHINYNNRPEENIKEIEMIKYWCKSIDIPLYIRNIYEINRKDCMDYEMRELYESYTKKIRFMAYSSFNNIDIDNTDTDTNVNIYLGHNNDDCFENILTNILKENNYDNLNGMSVFTKIIEDKSICICLIRPMLNIKKECIYAFAKDNMIPFLKDSTPKWSQRGKIRDIVRPTLTEWDSEFINSLFKLSERLNDISKIFKVNGVNNIFTNIAYELESDIGYVLNINDINVKENIINNKYLWTETFKCLKIYVSSKSINNFIFVINKIITKNNDKCGIKKGFIILNKKNKIIWNIKDTFITLKHLTFY